jgi:hypothetical protein
MFVAAVLVLVLHTLMDLVLAREPGVSIADHGVPLTASLALLALAAAGYGILPRGGRGLLSLLLGALSLEGAALAVADARAVGARGDDWTGLALAPVGLLLLALGVSLLWDSRKPYGHRYVRRVLLALAAMVGLYWVLLPTGFALMATHRPREAAISLPLLRRRRADARGRSRQRGPAPSWPTAPGSVRCGSRLCVGSRAHSHCRRRPRRQQP